MDADLFPPALLTAREMAVADRLAIAAGTSGHCLMERAGQAVADVCLASLGGRANARIAVLCGPGNNGGDGFVAARLLSEAGHAVAVAAPVEREHLRGDAALAAQAWTGSVEPMDAIDIAGADLVVDALFGAGLTRSLAGPAARAVERMNGSGRPIVAVDLPSGLDGDTGQVMGTAAVRASTTITFFRLKPGHLLMPGRSHCGQVVLRDIGISDAVLDEIAPKTLFNTPGLWRTDYPFPSTDGHKYSRGHALVLSGAMPTIGAARLAARGALRIGAGLVTVASPPDALAAHAAQLTSIMLRVVDSPAALKDVLEDRRKNAVVLGPGLGVGDETRTLLAAAFSAAGGPHPRSFVVDADALTSFAGDAGGLAKLISAAPGPVVVTPHDGEFARLFEGEGDEFRDASKLVRARAGAARLGAVLILKGPDTVVASHDGRAAIAGADAPWLATAGSGDVLAGMVGGLLAQGMDPFLAACAAVYLHAAAARHFGPGLISDDLPETLPAVLKELLVSPSR